LRGLLMRNFLGFLEAAVVLVAVGLLLSILILA
jgi:hypothetical protein